MNQVQMRERGVNYIQAAKNIVESYPFGLVHGLQKDAIQNGWDAVEHKTKSHVMSRWKMEFKLVNQKGRQLLIIQDTGTTGLTGKMTADEIAENTIPPEKERWARWEMLAAGKGNSASLGERGQGKMLLIAASKNHEIYYESLRNDGSYRMGWTQATTTSCPLYMMDDKDGGKEHIKEKASIEPLDEQGSRFIIIDPKSEIVDAVIDGSLAKYISETWWPIILKFGASIYVHDGKRSTRITPPELFPIKEGSKESGQFKLWVKNNISLVFNRENFRIKHIHLAFTENGLDELLSGVSIFRGGMKITKLEFPTRSFRNKIYGYVEFDEALDRKIKELEFASHYNFRTEGVWRKTKDIIEEEMEAFGAKKLGLGIDARAKENKKRTAAQNKAMSILRNVTKDWPFANNSAGTGGGSGGGEKPIKPIGLQLTNLKFPNEGNVPRLDYGQKLSNFNVKVFNKSKERVHLQYNANILSGDRVIIDLDSQKVILDKDSDTLLDDGYSFTISKEIFPEPGIYRMRFTVRNILSEQKKLEDEITRRFWVDADPELGGPFDIEFIDFGEIPESPSPVTAEWHLHPQGSGRYTLYVNSGHPSYMENEDTEAKQTRYLSEIYCMAALKLLLNQALNKTIDPEKVAQNLPFNPEAILNSDPKQMYQELAWAISGIRFSIDKDF